MSLLGEVVSLVSPLSLFDPHEPKIVWQFRYQTSHVVQPEYYLFDDLPEGCLLVRDSEFPLPTLTSPYLDSHLLLIVDLGALHYLVLYRIPCADQPSSITTS
jgi:hypothetical protein